MKAVEQLKKEHNAVKLTLRVLDKICKQLEAGDEINTGDLESLLDFFKVFVDKCHHAKEENMLFVALEGSDDPSHGDRIGALIKDHATGRNYIRELSRAVAEYKVGNVAAGTEILHYAKNYITLLIQHIDVEDNVLYPLADERLSPLKQEELAKDFDRLETEEIGVGRHEEFHRMIERLRDTYLP